MALKENCETLVRFLLCKVFTLPEQTTKTPLCSVFQALSLTMSRLDASSSISCPVLSDSYLVRLLTTYNFIYPFVSLWWSRVTQKRASGCVPPVMSTPNISAGFDICGNFSAK